MTCDKGRPYTGPFKPTEVCPTCGSRNLRIGCSYQDCQECKDVEQTLCRNCGAVFGGALYWGITYLPKGDLR